MSTNLVPAANHIARNKKTASAVFLLGDSEQTALLAWRNRKTFPYEQWLGGKVPGYVVADMRTRDPPSHLELVL